MAHAYSTFHPVILSSESSVHAGASHVPRVGSHCQPRKESAGAIKRDALPSCRNRRRSSASALHCRRRLRHSVVCQGEPPKDTRIHWGSSNEGWIRGPDDNSPSAPSSAYSGLTYTRPDLVPLLLQAENTHYQILGVAPDATEEEIKAAYRKLSKLYHPDSTSLPLGIAAARFMRLKEAHTVLTTPERRRFYDWKLAQEVSQQTGGGFIWPYEADRSQQGMGSLTPDQLRAMRSPLKKTTGENLPLSDQSTTALVFDLFALIVSIASIAFYLYRHQ